MDKTVSDIGQIAVTVSDVAKALAFYRDALGLAFLFSPAPTLAFLQAGRSARRSWPRACPTTNCGSASSATRTATWWA